MKTSQFHFSKVRGFTLIESLIALLIFSIIVLGSGIALQQMLIVQKDIGQNYVLLNAMQNRLQNALNHGVSNDLCTSVDLTSLIVNHTTFYFACSTEIMNEIGTATYWPILTASPDLKSAQDCAAHPDTPNTCYIVGR